MKRALLVSLIVGIASTACGEADDLEASSHSGPRHAVRAEGQLSDDDAQRAIDIAHNDRRMQDTFGQFGLQYDVVREPAANYASDGNVVVEVSLSQAAPTDRWKGASCDLNKGDRPITRVLVLVDVARERVSGISPSWGDDQVICARY